MELKLKGNKVIVSAGGSGIGLAIVQGFLAEGAEVATCDINPELVSELKRNHPSVYGEEVDVADAQAVQQFTQSAIGKLGGLDCLVNNAGIAGPTSPIEEIPEADWERCLSVCLNSQYFFIKASVFSLRKSSNPSIVNISSAAGKYGFAFRTPYSTAKWGVIGLTKSLAIELGPDQIRVNAILPGLVSGERQKRVLTAKAEKRGVSFDEIEQEAFSYTSIKSYVTPQDIANQVLYLASERGKLISGQAISVDGDTRMLA
ncbi:MAG: SDR family oxidoreductase [SAR324 cluster bacterium]|nr:SDR family oxidoreductase [SAR324 cluster bacterium]